MGQKQELQQPRYLGDGVYIHDEGFRVAIAVNHHTNKVVYMEREQIKAFIQYVRETNLLKDQEE